MLDKTSKDELFKLLANNIVKNAIITGNNTGINVAKLVDEVEAFYDKHQYSVCRFYHQPDYNALYDWPNNLILELGIQYLSDNNVKELESNLEYCINNFLTDREKYVIMKYYKEKETLKNIAKNIQEKELTIERIRQIKSKALRKLSVEYRLQIIKYGPGFINELKDKYYKEVNEYETKLKEVKEKRDALEKFLSDNDELNNIIKEDCKKACRSILELELSVRSYNCLTRAGYKYIEDLEGITSDDLIKIRNLGRRSYQEIVSKLANEGINVIT